MRSFKRKSGLTFVLARLMPTLSPTPLVLPFCYWSRGLLASLFNCLIVQRLSFLVLRFLYGDGCFTRPKPTIRIRLLGALCLDIHSCRDSPFYYARCVRWGLASLLGHCARHAWLIPSRCFAWWSCSYCFSFNFSPGLIRALVFPFFWCNLTYASLRISLGRNVRSSINRNALNIDASPVLLFS
jgi:hypothetical protein